MRAWVGDEEFDALRGLPHLPRLLYLGAIRPRMEEGGAVGVARRVSWSALAEDLEVYGDEGIKGEKPTRWALIRAAKQLRKNGLIGWDEEAGKAGRRLIFECFLAQQGNCEVFKPAQKPHSQPAPNAHKKSPEETAACEDVEHEAAQAFNAEPAQHKRIKNKDKDKEKRLKHLADSAGANQPCGELPGAGGKFVYPEAFEDVWSAYPKRPNDSKRGAYRAWEARRRAGDDTAEMLAGVHRYRAYCESRGIVGQEYVKQAKTFFGPDRHWEADWGRVIPITAKSRAEFRRNQNRAQIVDAVREFSEG